MKPIHLRNIPPPNETFDHTAIIAFIASYLRPERYLELGVRSGRTLVPVAAHCTEAIGVDISPCPVQIPRNVRYHQTTTDNYFDTCDTGERYDMVFIDADHSFEQSLKDFQNVKDRVIDDGIIFLHDTYPYDAAMFAPHLCNDVYKTAHYIKTNYGDEFESLTLPFNPGVTIVKKIPKTKQLIYL